MAITLHSLCIWFLFSLAAIGWMLWAMERAPHEDVLWPKDETRN